MKPCGANRQAIAWLVVGALDDEPARKLRSHLQTCEGCRAYLEDISNVTEKLSAAEISSGVSASESFHGRVVTKVGAQHRAFGWAIFLAGLQQSKFTRRIALPVFVGALGILLLLQAGRKPVKPDSAPITRGPVAPTYVEKDLAPTIANYQAIAGQSIDKFDALLSQQATRTQTSAPIYTAANLTD